MMLPSWWSRLGEDTYHPSLHAPFHGLYQQTHHPCLHRKGYVPQGTTAEKLYAAKVIYDSAFHLDSGERMWALGTMCAQVPGGMVITGILLAYYK